MWNYAFKKKKKRKSKLSSPGLSLQTHIRTFQLSNPCNRVKAKFYSPCTLLYMSFPLSKVGLTFHELKSIWRCGQVLNSSWVKANNGHSLGHNITEARRNKQGFDLPHVTSLTRLLQVSLFVNNEQAAVSPGSALHMKKEDGRGRQDDDFSQILWDGPMKQRSIH